MPVSAYRGNSAPAQGAASDKPILVTLTGETIGQTVAISSGTLAVDLDSGDFVTVDLDANISTFTISNPPTSGNFGSVLFKFTADGTQRTISWPSGTVWPGGSAPTMSSTNGRSDLIALGTDDGGTTWYGMVIGQNYA